MGGLAWPCRFSFELRRPIASWPCNDLPVSCWAWLSSGALPALCAGDAWDDISRRMEQDFVMEENPGCKMHSEFLCRFARMKIPSFAVLQMLMLTV